ncbi:PREDICTED: rootletin-like [Priapulus caudatus]|uniref:Rootletin-like n=1 Tax=Priapulus caudatus TaxID=37621 RepID=A0ABM1F4A4_PRICU|nr:PREDICTED: rootletin-like [Priapulus caudatus]
MARDQLKTGKPQLRQGLYKKHVPLRGQQEEEELDPTEVKLQMEGPKMFARSKSLDSDVQLDARKQASLMESEVGILREKLADLEATSDRLGDDNLRLRIAAGRKVPVIHTDDQALENIELKGPKMFARSKSLDSDVQLDARKQASLMESEVGILRQKLADLEATSDRLGDDNLRLRIAAGRKVPVIHTDDQALENIELKDKLREMENMCVEMQERCVAMETEQHRGEDARASRRKLAELEEENASLRAAISRRRGSTGSVRSEEREERQQQEGMPETREGMRRRITEQDEEIDDLLVIIKGREGTNEQLEEEVQTYKHEMQRATLANKEKQDKLLNELKQALDNNAEMAVQLQMMVQRTEYAKSEMSKLRASAELSDGGKDGGGEAIKDKSVLNKYEIKRDR